MRTLRQDAPNRKGRTVLRTCALLATLLAAAYSLADPPADTLPPPRPLPEREVEAIHAPWETQVMPIDLPTALRLAQTTNLDVARARQVVAQAQAQLDRAKVMALPNINYGSTYVDHAGHLQQSSGDIINRDRTSLWVGGGPSMIFPISEAFFAPLAARQVVAATEAGVTRVTNDTLLSVADAYFLVLRSRRRLAALAETIEQLTSPRPGAIRGQTKGLLPMVRDFVDVGGKEALRADVYRVEVEVYRRRNDVSFALQELRVFMAELARLLHLDPEVPLLPVEDYRAEVPLPGQAWMTAGLDSLVGFALNNRPELAENQALILAAVERVRAAQWRPYIPNLALNYNDGWFGGSPIIWGKSASGSDQFGNSGQINNFGHRSDFDVTLVWQFRNLGFGNRAEVFEQKVLHEQTLLRQVQIRDQVVTQVVQAQEQVTGSRERLRIIRAGLFGADGGATGPAFQSLRLSLERIKQGEGRPLEALDSVRGLNDLLNAYADALTEYERSHFRLLIALGIPPHAFLDPQALPPPCLPVGQASSLPSE
jgi:outer membrane protein TolC